MSIYRQIARGVVVATGALYAWHDRFFVNPDGVAYLDVADRLRAGGWSFAVSTHRGPLYPLLLAIVDRVPPYYESTVAHGLTFLLYCAAFAAYEFFLAALRRTKQGGEMPDALWIPLAYGLFLWSFNFADQTGPAVLTPDLLVAAGVFAASALLVRIANGAGAWPAYMALGVTLGIGYLAKEAMLPLGALMLAAAAVAGGRQRLWRVAAAAVLFAAIASAYFVPLSLKLGRPSTGETARYNYVLWVSAAGKPANPRLLLDRAPLVIGYPEAAGRGTYAVHDDLRFWLAGLRPRFDAHAQLRAVRRGVEAYSQILRSPLHFALLVVFLTLFISAPNRWEALRRYWVVTLPAAAGLAMFGLVLVEPRYIAPSLAVLWIGLFAGFGAEPARLAARAMTAAWIAVSIVLLTGPDVRLQLQQLRQPAVHDNWLLAEHLRRAGVRPGDRVAVVGPPYMCYWARLAGVRIAAEVVDPREFQLADERARAGAAAALQRFGVRAIVAAQPAPANSPGWETVGGTSYSVCVLPAPVAWKAAS